MVSPIVRQSWAVSGVLINMLAQGMVLSYPSSLLPGLQSPDSDIKVDINIASWLASSVGVSGIPGFLVSSFLMDWRGRKLAHILVLAPGIIGWLLIFFARNVALLMIGRFLNGFTTGGTVFLGAVVIGEYSCPKSRGTFLNLKTAGVCLGSMVIHILGYYFHWRTVALLGMLPFVVSFIIICTWPESPAWLASTGKFEDSEKSFYWLRGRDEDSEKEFNELIKAQKMKAAYNKRTSACETITDFLLKFTKRDFVKPLIIIVVSAVLIEASGRHVFPAYALPIIEEVTGDNLQTFYYTLGIDLIITTSATFSSVLVKVYKRRTILFITGFSALFVLIMACSYLYLVTVGLISKSYPWIPVALFVLFFILVNLGCTPIPIALLGEVLPLAHRAAGSAVAGFVLSVAVVAALKVTPYLLASIKVYGTFGVFGITMGLSLLMFYFILPETKDRTLQEIEDYFNNGRFRDEEEDRKGEEGVRMKMIT
ncbi:unnamed protein product, partial [Iphiclides podalirius]